MRNSLTLLVRCSVFSLADAISKHPDTMHSSENYYSRIPGLPCGRKYILRNAQAMTIQRFRDRARPILWRALHYSILSVFFLIPWWTPLVSDSTLILTYVR